MQTLKIGFVVNPIAGMGGKVALKGTDGDKILQEAIERGAKPISPIRAKSFLKALSEKNIPFEIYTAGGNMGEDVCKELNIPAIVIYKPNNPTTFQDTRNYIKRVKDIVDLIVFVGGDGTARDIITVINSTIPVLGVPSGVKVTSECFAVNAEAASEIIKEYILNKKTFEAEVIDVDEEAYRKGELKIKIYGYAKVPYIQKYIQSSKSPSLSTENERDNQNAIAKYIIEKMEPDVIYFLGAGTTVSAITHMLSLEKTLLGVDAIKNKKILKMDLTEFEIYNMITDNSKIIISPIGKQGFIFGRGNHQFSSRIIRKLGLENIIVIATRRKIESIGSKLRIDFYDDEMLNNELNGKYIRVLVDYNESRMMKIVYEK